MFSNIGIPGLIIILLLALMVFGPSKLPQIGRAVGTSLREFKETYKLLKKSPLNKKMHRKRRLHAAGVLMRLWRKTVRPHPDV